MEISGKIIAVLPLKSGIGKNGAEWKKQSYVIQTQDQYPKKMCFDLWGAKIDEMGVMEGQDLDVYFDIDCKEWNGVYFNEIRPYKIVQRNIHQYENSSFQKEEKKVKDDLPF